MWYYITSFHVMCQTQSACSELANIEVMFSVAIVFLYCKKICSQVCSVLRQKSSQLSAHTEASSCHELYTIILLQL